MARRFIFQGGGSPFRISATGADARTGGFEEMLFDGQWVSLPIYANVGFAGSPGDYAMNVTVPGPTLKYTNVNTYTFGKTFSAPPMFTALGPGRAANTYNVLPWTGPGATYTYGRMSDVSCQRPYIHGDLGVSINQVFGFGVFATTTTLRSNRPGRFLIFDKPLS